MKQEQTRTLRSHLEKELNCHAEEKDLVSTFLRIAISLKSSGRHEYAKKIARGALD